MPQPTTLSVLGLGSMGAALAGALLDAGHPVTVWNRTAARAEPLVARGARTAGSPREALAAEVSIVCLRDAAAVEATFDAARADADTGASAGGSLDGRIVVDLTNGSPSQARAVAARAAELGARPLDGGIMAVPPMIGSPRALVLYSGDRGAFDRAEPALSALGRAVFVGDAPGLASLHDLALLSAMYGMFAGATHAVALLGSAGVDAQPFTDELMTPWLSAMLASLPPDAASSESGAEMQVSGLRTLLEAGREQGVDDELAGHLRSAMVPLLAA